MELYKCLGKKVVKNLSRIIDKSNRVLVKVNICIKLIQFNSKLYLIENAFVAQIKYNCYYLLSHIVNKLLLFYLPTYLCKEQ